MWLDSPAGNAVSLLTPEGMYLCRWVTELEWPMDNPWTKCDPSRPCLASYWRTSTHPSDRMFQLRGIRCAGPSEMWPSTTCTDIYPSKDSTSYTIMSWLNVRHSYAGRRSVSEPQRGDTYSQKSLERTLADWYPLDPFTRRWEESTRLHESTWSSEESRVVAAILL